MRVYAQSYNSRIGVTYHQYEPFDSDKRTVAHITLGGGWTTYYREHTIVLEPDTVAAALDSGDEKVQAIWKRILKEFDKLDEEAPKALKRVERARKRALKAAA
jgi:threonine dehydrogenase-like Zn-dependent dehydrogenase